MTSKNREPLLRCNHVSKRFGGTAALVDVSVEFPTAGLLVIIGGNGAGKTTLLDVITGYVTPDDGSVVFNGHVLRDEQPHVRARAGLVRTFQGNRVIRRLKPWEHLLVASNHSGRSLFRPATVSPRLLTHLDEWGLGDRAFYPAGDLSAGQQRLLGVLTALSAQPRVFLCDEPTAGLSPDRAKNVVDLLRKFTADKLAVVIEHNLQVIDGADFVLELNAGRVVRFEDFRA